MITSIWNDTSTLPSFPALMQDETHEVCIIGGGMAGILCAYFLHIAGVDCLLCEADTIGSGTTAGTTAVISAQHDTFYGTLMKKKGYTNARLYLEANLHAVNAFKEIAQDVSCDFSEIPACIFSRKSGSLIDDEVKALHSLGYNARQKSEIPLPIAVRGAVEFPDQAQFHPLKFLAEIAKDLPIREHTRIVSINKNEAFTAHHKITAKHLIITTHFPFLNTCGLYFAKLHQRRSYVLALKGAAVTPGSYVEYEKNGLYFRSHNEYLLVGGGDHRTGKAACNYEPLRDFADTYYPDAGESYAWSAQDCISLDGVPYIGPYSNIQPNLYVASGFNEWGMTSSMVAAQILTDTILGRENKYAAVFSPDRSMLTGKLFINLGVSIAGLLTPSKKRCPHLGCALKWNACEHTWDCPCHGSRFTADGKLICNPATGDLPDCLPPH